MYANSSGDIFWFENPDVEITLTDETMRAKIKQLFMESELELPSRKSVLYDSKLSKYVGFHVGYTRRSWLRDLIARINKKCNLSIDTTAPTIKIHTNNGIFMLATHSGRVYQCKLYTYYNCSCVQDDFALRNNMPTIDPHTQECVVMPIYRQYGKKPAPIQIIR